LQVRLLLLPLSSLLLESKELLGLLGLCKGPLSIKVLQLLLVAITLLIELPLELCISEVSFRLNGVDLLLESLFSFKRLLQSLFERALLGHLRFVEQLVLLEETLLLALKLLISGLQFNDLSLGAFLNLFEQLLLLVLKLHELELMSVFKLLLRLRCVLGQPVEGDLEVPLGILAVLLGSVALLLQELEFPFPESLVTIIGIVKVLILAIELSKLFLLSLDLFLDESLVTVESLHQLLIGIL
jgi:hypothetical protein